MCFQPHLYVLCLCSSAISVLGMVSAFADAVIATIKPTITKAKPADSAPAGICPKTGHPINAAKPGARTGKMDARPGPKRETALA